MAEKEYIDRRIVLKPFSRRISKLSDEPIIIGINQVLSHAEEFVKSLPAADVAPVKHGHWQQVDDTKCKCSGCEAIAYIAQYPPSADKNYCPNCGAKMDGGEQK